MDLLNVLYIINYVNTQNTTIGYAG